MKTTIDLLRHGEAEGGTYYRGSTDDPLTENGWQQMQHAVASPMGWNLIVSSPLSRCRQFAEHLSQKINLPLIIEQNLAEIYFGDWEGKTADEIQKISPAALAAFYQDPINNSPLSAETYPDFLLRIQTVWQELLNQYPTKHILVITHAGVIRALLSQTLEIPLIKTFAIQCDHAGLSRLEVFHAQDNKFTQLVFHNR